MVQQLWTVVAVRNCEAASDVHVGQPVLTARIAQRTMTLAMQPSPQLSLREPGQIGRSYEQVPCAIARGLLMNAHSYSVRNSLGRP